MGLATSSPPVNRSAMPSRAVIERIMTEEAHKAGINPGLFISSRGVPGIGPLRGAAWLRILNETGCSVGNLAKALGADRSGVNRQVNRARQMAAAVELQAEAA
jgi:hypothetical protein